MGKSFNPFPKKKKTSPDPPGDEAAVLPNTTPQDALKPGEEAIRPGPVPPSAAAVQARCSDANTDLLVTPGGLLFQPLVWGKPPLCLYIPAALQSSLQESRERGYRENLEFGGWILHRGRSHLHISRAFKGQEHQFLQEPWRVAEEEWGEPVSGVDLDAWEEQNPVLLFFHSHVFPPAHARWKQAGHGGGDMANFIDPLYTTRNITMVAGPLGIYAAAKTTETALPTWDYVFGGISGTTLDGDAALKRVHDDWVKDRITEGRECKFYVYYSPWPTTPGTDHFVALLGP